MPENRTYWNAYFKAWKERIKMSELSTTSPDSGLMASSAHYVSVKATTGVTDGSTLPTWYFQKERKLRATRDRRRAKADQAYSDAVTKLWESATGIDSHALSSIIPRDAS